jgi:hypothetical protein
MGLDKKTPKNVGKIDVPNSAGQLIFVPNYDGKLIFFANYNGKPFFALISTLPGTKNG